MNTRLSLVVVVLGLAVASLTFGLDVDGLDTSSSARGLQLVAMMFALLVSELGRRAGGRVAWPWIASCTLITVAGLVLGVIALSQARHPFELIFGTAMTLLVAALIPVLLVQNHRHRLGLPRHRP